MTKRRQAKSTQPQLVAVIASAADLTVAVKMEQPPDLFELRLDCLVPVTNRLEKKILRLRAPLLITARDPREGGANNLSFSARHDLLLRFLPRAKFIDFELRSAEKFKSLVDHAKNQKTGRILSYHNFQATPSSQSLCAKAKRARRMGADVFKVATRIDTHGALARLINFINSNDLGLPISAMGIGKLGAISRLLLARSGSALNYASLTQPNVEGQLSIEMLRSALPG
jgi:3-dehydroquinate dehydratase-1